MGKNLIWSPGGPYSQATLSPVPRPGPHPLPTLARATPGPPQHAVTHLAPRILIYLPPRPLSCSLSSSRTCGFPVSALNWDFLSLASGQSLTQKVFASSQDPPSSFLLYLRMCSK